MFSLSRFEKKPSMTNALNSGVRRFLVDKLVHKLPWLARPEICTANGHCRSFQSWNLNDLVDCCASSRSRPLNAINLKKLISCCAALNRLRFPVRRQVLDFVFLLCFHFSPVRCLFSQKTDCQSFATSPSSPLGQPSGPQSESSP